MSSLCPDNRTPVLVAGLAVCLATAPAWAADWSVSPAVTMSVEHDSNIRFERDGAASSQADWLTRVTPRVTARRATPASRVQLQVQVEGEKYARHHDLDDLTGSATAAVTTRWGETQKMELAVSARQDSTLEGELTGSGTLTRRVDRQVGGVEVGLERAVGEKTSFAANAGLTLVAYPDDDFNDQAASTLGLEVARRLNPRDQVGVSGRYRHTSYDGSTGTSEGFGSFGAGPGIYTLTDHREDATIRTTAASLFWRRRLSERDRLTASLGVEHTGTERPATRQDRLAWADGTRTRVLLDDAVDQTDTGLFFELGLEKYLSERLSLSLSVGRKHFATVDAITTERLYGRGSLGYRLSERAETGLALAYDWNDAVPDRAVDSSFASLQPFYRWRWSQDTVLRAGLTHTFYREDDPTGDDDMDRTRIWLQAEVLWPELWRNR
ncbi:MAG: hypothetical protein AB1634_17540 [Thermodesulfobacteriota bacterium]